MDEADTELPPKRRIDLGLELLLARRDEKAAFTCDEIAAWTGTTRQYIHRIERNAVHKLIKGFRKNGIRILTRISTVNRK